MVNPRKPSQYELVIPSVLEKIHEVERYTEKIGEKIHLSQEVKDSLAIAVSEAVNNAIVHGNKKQKDKKVIIKYLLSENAITVYVHDEGEGFDPEAISNPLEPENLLKESGRGIFIIKALMDEVTFDFSEKGTVVKMVKYKKDVSMRE